jgi:TrmH family RNA methyltransferase
VADTGPDGQAPRFDPDDVRFVLVQPSSAGNVGAAARAIGNLGFRRLVLVAPECDPGADEARRRAVGCVGILDAARVCGDLDEALDTAGTVVGTSRRVGKHRRPHFRLHRFAGEMAGLAAAGELAVVFGREDRGLTDLELDRCTHLLHVHAVAEHPSYNLAQSVLLVAYELALAGSVPGSEPASGPPAAHEEREEMYRHLETALESIGFLHGDTPEVTMRRIRRVLGRAGLTSLEVRIFRGLARQTLWAAGRAGLRPPDTD